MKKLLSLVASLFLIAIIAGSIWVVLNRQYLQDQYMVSQYNPDAAILTLVKNTKLSSQGTFYFYATHPEVNTAQEFNQACQKQETGSAILGCYSNGRIYVYDVPDERLSGIEEVTAAHEMLHAAYARLGDEERARVDRLLETAYAHLKTPELETRMKYYDHAEPGESLNELHSILPTEFRDLGPELEEYYKKYFTDRLAIVLFHEKYQQVFHDLEAQSARLKTQLDQLNSTIEGKTADYEASRVSLQVEGASLENAYQSLDRTSASEVNAYNARVQSYNGQLAYLRAAYNEITSLVAQYNELVKQYNSVVTSQRELNQKIDSTAPPSQPL